MPDRPFLSRRLLSLQAGGSDAAPSRADVEAPIVQAKIARGVLRRDPCVSGTVVELGSQLACHGCDRPVSADEVEMRARFADGEFLRFHARCFAAWHTATQR